MRLNKLALGISLFIASTLNAQAPSAARPVEENLPAAEAPAVTPDGGLQMEPVRAAASIRPGETAVSGDTATAPFTVFSTASLPLFHVTDSGLVGFGTSSPAYALDMQRTSGATALRLSSTDTASYEGFLFYEGTTKKAHITSQNSTSTGIGGANALQLWNNFTAPIVLGTTNAERMRIHGNGNVSIGTSVDGGSLYVRSFVPGTTITSFGTRSYTANVTQDEIMYTGSMTGTASAGVTNSGTLYGARLFTYAGGAGTVNTVVGIRTDTGIVTGATAVVNKAIGASINIPAGAGVVQEGYGVLVGDVVADDAYAFFQGVSNDRNYFAGQVLVGSLTLTSGKENVKFHVTGDAHFTGTVSGGNIQAKYQDVAEWVPAAKDLEPGTVVVLSGTRNNEVTASSTPYDTMVAGVVSAQPGLSLGVGGEGKEQVATTGRVKVRVDARNQPVRIGDLLVTSEVPGTAMKSLPTEINGRKFHQPGTIIGKALEPLEGGIGEILVLLSLQ